jgi:hypothetical protein
MLMEKLVDFGISTFSLLLQVIAIEIVSLGIRSCSIRHCHARTHSHGRYSPFVLQAHKGMRGGSGTLTQLESLDLSHNDLTGRFRSRSARP